MTLPTMTTSVYPYLQTLAGEQIKLGTIYCIGRNYREHAQEMNAPVPAEPVVFIKPPSAYVPDGGCIVAPEAGHLLHHEVEIVAVVGKVLRHASTADAASAIAGYAIGIDVTLRDIQQRAKEQGLPWSIAKGFATSAPMSHVVPAESIGSLDQLEFGLAVNGVERQRGTPSQMIWSVPELLAFLSKWFVLQAGDVVFTGTPEGVGPLANGDRIHAWLGDVVTLEVQVSIPAQ